jgi:hypothetical protein
MLLRWLTILILPPSLQAGVIPLPERVAGMPAGSEVASTVTELPLAEREALLVREISSGNVPPWWRKFVPVTVHQEVRGRPHTLIYEVSPDVVMVGDALDAMRVPLSPPAAQHLADAMDCLLPTPKMVGQIYAAAEVKLTPQPLPPSPDMTGFRKFLEHETLVDAQRAQNKAPPGTLVAGHKKDVVVCSKLCDATGKVAIYGWHKADATPIQALYLGHSENWVDYSHGVRLVRRTMMLDGHPLAAETVLADTDLCVLLSDEGAVFHPRYDTDRTTTMKLEPSVRVVLKSPLWLDPKQPVHLAVFATPNGGTAEQAIGRTMVPGQDWQYHIQNIGAQTHWLRDHAGLKNLVVAYVEPEGKSWPAWKGKFDPQSKLIPGLVDRISARYAGQEVRITLTGHSGGGSFIFGYLDAVPEIPANLERIAFLDSNYHWKSDLHAAKVTTWLNSSLDHKLCVIAYEDCVALLNGKTFVSQSGGTWGRSLCMLEDLKSTFPLERNDDDTFIQATSAHGQIQFLLRKNPEKKILHSVLVERNGFIHGLLSGTKSVGQGYQYFGERAYGNSRK